jgi:hypothetical protein
MSNAIHFEDQTAEPTVTTPPPRSARPRTWRTAALYIALAAVPGTAAAIVGRRSKLLGAIVGSATALGIAAFRWQLQRLFTDEPAFETVKRIGKLELRAYPSRVEAHTHLDTARFEDALEQGFHRLAGYIFGANGAHESLPMSTPVSARGEKLAMTAPVIASDQEGSYTMAFVMPPGRDLASLPRPLDPSVRLREIPERQVAVVRFRGRHESHNVAAAERELLRLVAASDLTPVGKPTFAGFDPPTTLPILRRNEVWIEVV